MIIITLNLGGLPRPRYTTARAKAFCARDEVQNADIINLQEVHTYRLFYILRHDLTEFPHIASKPGVFGPRAGLVTFSKVPIRDTSFLPFAGPTRRVDPSIVPNTITLQSLHKGVLISRLAGRLVIMNAHLNPNRDGDWSPGSRFYPVHQAQLNALLGLVRRPPYSDEALVITGDFNLAKDSDLYEDFIQRGGWSDAFRDNVAPTFHAKYLRTGRSPHCIDYILTKDTAGGLETANAVQLFRDKIALSGGKRAYVSDHIGLGVTVRPSSSVSWGPTGGEPPR